MLHGYCGQRSREYASSCCDRGAPRQQPMCIPVPAASTGSKLCGAGWINSPQALVRGEEPCRRVTAAVTQSAQRRSACGTPCVPFAWAHGRVGWPMPNKTHSPEGQEVGGGLARPSPAHGSPAQVTGTMRRGAEATSHRPSPRHASQTMRVHNTVMGPLTVLPTVIEQCTHQWHHRWQSY